MPLHIPNIFGRSRSRSTGVRTDLCNTYKYTTEERKAQGYGNRSDWHHAITLLGSMLEIAAEGSEEIDWDNWSVDSEMRDVRSFHFEDLDQTDQMLCPMHTDMIINSTALLRGKVNQNTFRKLEDVMGQLLSFKAQAEQLYGKEACAAKGTRMIRERLPR